MKSKTLLLANIFATMLTLTIIIITFAAINAMGGFEGLLQFGKQYAEAEFESFSEWYVISGPFTLILQVIILVISTVIGWMSWLNKNCKSAIIFASLYLFGILCYAMFVIESLPVIILGFVGAYNQKKLNNGGGDNIKPQQTPMRRLY